MDDAEVRQQIEALEALLAGLPSDAAGAVAALLRLYGETLRRMVSAADNAPEVSAAFARDELIANMLALHDLFALERPEPARPAAERCDLCSEVLTEAHPHLFDASEKTVLCACAVCALLFPQRADASGRYRFIPETSTYLQDLVFDELTWNALEIPVHVAYFVRSPETGHVVAYYPSPVGAVESLLRLDAWQQLEQRNPMLRELVGDTQALLVNAMDGVAEGWIVGIDVCYRLIAVMRTHWRGLRGGDGVRTELKRFFDELRGASVPHRIGEIHDVTQVAL
jgi:Family of unknown function (DUF5947)